MYILSTMNFISFSFLNWDLIWDTHILHVWTSLAKYSVTSRLPTVFHILLANCLKIMYLIMDKRKIAYFCKQLSISYIHCNIYSSWNDTIWSNPLQCKEIREVFSVCFYDCYVGYLKYISGLHNGTASVFSSIYSNKFSCL